jgi:Uncharacterized protein conserved in archaea (DUF2180)
MNCLSCARLGTERGAVALCPQCQSGLCLEHINEGVANGGPRGMSIKCGHRAWSHAADGKRQQSGARS